MYNFKTLTCYNCKSVMLNLPEVEISKLNGLNFIVIAAGIKIFSRRTSSRKVSIIMTLSQHHERGLNDFIT